MPRSLPAELVQMILEEDVLTKGDLRILRQVNRFFHSVTSPLLFETVYFFYVRPAIEAFFAIIRDPSIAQHVKTIEWDDRKVTDPAGDCREDLMALFHGYHGFDRRGNDAKMPEYALGEKEVEQSCIPDVEALREAIRRLPNLQAIKLLGSDRLSSYGSDTPLPPSRFHPTLQGQKLSDWYYHEANQYGPESIWSLGNITYVPGLQRGFAVVVMALSMETHSVRCFEVQCDKQRLATGLDHKVFVQPPISKGFSKAFGQLRHVEFCLAGDLSAFGASQQHVHRLAPVFRALRRCHNLEHLGITGPFLSETCRSSFTILAPVLERLLSLKLKNACIISSADPLASQRSHRHISDFLPQILGYCTRLRRLSIQAPWQQRWARPVGLGFSPSSRLEDLTDRPGNWSYIVADDSTWPSLEVVSMTEAVAHIDQFCDFLWRHKESLKVVNWVNCQLYDNSAKDLAREVLEQRLNELGLKYQIHEDTKTQRQSQAAFRSLTIRSIRPPIIEWWK